MSNSILPQLFTVTQADWVTSASSNNVDVNYTRDELYSPNDTLIWIPAGTSQEWVQVDMLTVSDVVKVIEDEVCSLHRMSFEMPETIFWKLQCQTFIDIPGEPY